LFVWNSCGDPRQPRVVRRLTRLLTDHRTPGLTTTKLESIK
jgi:hypothetical protein